MGMRLKEVITARRAEPGIDLYWLPLGAGGWFVRLNGRLYEAICARLERRAPLDLYHSALEVCVPEGRFVIENAWPIPDADGGRRGAVVQGPVGARGLARFRTFRYEIRCWRNGVIPDMAWAVASPQRLSDDPGQAGDLLDLVRSVPAFVWGRDELGAGDMWNSNSVISWLLARSGLPADTIRPPAGGRAPGWGAGLLAARRTGHNRAPQCQDGADDGERQRPLSERWNETSSIRGQPAAVGRRLREESECCTAAPRGKDRMWETDEGL